MTDEQIYAMDARDYMPVFARYQIVLDHGDGVYVYDSHGKKYIDFLGGIAVNVLGHTNSSAIYIVNTCIDIKAFSGVILPKALQG